MDEKKPLAKKNRSGSIICNKENKQPLKVSVKTKNQLISASSKKNDRNFEIREHLDQMVYHQSCYKNYLSSARRSNERSQEEQEGTEKPEMNYKYHSKRFLRLKSVVDHLYV
jgi:hypothetical protein